jgi:hypothetical protein
MAMTAATIGETGFMVGLRVVAPWGERFPEA